MRTPFGRDLDAETRNTHGFDVSYERAVCALCGDVDASMVHRSCPDRLYWLPGRFDVVRCRTCGLIRTDPRPTEESVGAYYPRAYSPYASTDSLARRTPVRQLKSLLEFPFVLRYGSPPEMPAPHGSNGRVLDIGCGPGIFLAEMAARGWEPWAVEPNALLAREVAQRLDVPEERIFPGTLSEAPFPDGFFDLATMFHVLEHLYDPRGALTHVLRLLRPAGKVWITVPNVESFESKVFGSLWRGLEIPRHLYHFTPATLGGLLERCGFRVETVRPEFAIAPLSGSVRLLLDALLRRRRAYRDWRLLRYALSPVAALSLALGNAPVLSVTASRAR